MATVAVLDTAYLSSYCSLPEATIQSLVNEPTIDLVTTFLQQVIVKAREHDKLKAERLRVDVELENAVRGSSLRARTLKANADKALQDVEELRVKLNQEETARASLNDQLHTLQAEFSTSSAEVQNLQTQVAKLEKSNRDALALVDSRSTAQDKLAEELSSQHQKTIAVRREVSTLSERLQTAETSLSNAKHLESQLRGEIEQQKRNNDWLDSELKAKGAEHAKFRKEKNSRIAELQRLNDDSASNIELLQKTETTLRKRLEEVSRKAEEAFSKIQQLQEEAVRNEQSFRLELDTARRLAELQKQSADTARRRVKELEDVVEQVKDDAGEEISQAQAEIETERQSKEAAERKVEELEAQLEKLEVSMQSIGRPTTPNPARPDINGFGIPSTPARTRSPAIFSPASTRSRGGLSYTQMYTDYTTAKTELEAEKRRNEKLAQTLDELIKEMEKREPEIQESQVEQDRLESENAELSNILAITREERDTMKREAKKWQGLVTGSRREADLLKQQLRDLSAQIKTLLVEIQVREEGVEYSVDDRLQLQQLARGGIDNEVAQDTSDTARFISERLVPFKNLFEMQEKNTELLRIVRELGEQKESEEAKAKANMQAQTELELDSLRERMERYKDEMKSLVTQSQSYIRERDMFRRMLSHRGQLPPDADLESMFGSSTNAAPSPKTPRARHTEPTSEETPSAKDIADYSRLLKELQSQFDAYRRETATDYSTVKEQSAGLARDKTQLQVEVARINSQLTLAYERYQMLQANFDQTRGENDELRKRSQTLAEVAAKQDIRTQQVAEELVEAQSSSESLRHETANLKAEKDLWKKIEARLSDDNKALSEERSRLNRVLSDSQNLFNERELADAETRRKMQGQLESLEAQLRATSQKLEQELEASKNLNLRREVETEQHRTRVDDLLKVLSTTKEELLVAKTMRDQLQARVEELKIELRNAEERAQALQPRPTAGAAEPVSGGDMEDSSSLVREQTLAIEVADLKKEFDLLQNQLADTQTQVAQYKKISQSSEEELAALNDAADQYRAETDQVLSEKDSKINDLQRRVEEISTELSLSNEQLFTLRSTADQASAKVEQQRGHYEDQITRIKDEAESYREAAAFHEEDLKAQAEIAQQAQKNYENELVKHGEATKALQAVRVELNDVKLGVAQYKADADAAKATVTQNEDSWQATKERYEGEVMELKSRHDDLVAQNKVLHQQLESFSTQIAALQQKRDATRADPEIHEDHVPGTEKLQEIINYLRREKEIVDVQYELTVQEARRSRQQLEYTQSQLEDTRLKLDQERLRQTEREQSSINHSKLMDAINELNVFRESSVTLRNEARQAQAQLADKSKQVENLLAQLEPLKSSVHEMTNQRETREGEWKLLEADRDHWQQRAHNILQKYDRIDPEELEGLKEKLSNFENSKEENHTLIEKLQGQVDAIPEQVRTAQEEARKELRQRLVEQFKARSRELSEKIKEANSQSTTAKEQLEIAQENLRTTEAARDEANSRAEVLSLEITQLRLAQKHSDEASRATGGTEEGQVEEGEVAAQDNLGSELEARLRTAEAKTAEVTQQLGAAKIELEAALAGAARQAEAARVEMDSLRTTINELREQVQHLEAKTTSAASEGVSRPDRADNEGALTPGEAAIQPEVKPVSQEAQTRTAQENGTNGESATPMSANVEQEVAIFRAQLEANYSQRTQELEENYTKRIDNMRSQLTTKLTEGKKNIRAQLSKDHEEAMQTLQQEHLAAQTKLTEEHNALVAQIHTLHAQELDQLRKRTSQERAADSSRPTNEKDGLVATPTVKTEATAPSNEAEWSPERVRAFIAGNQTAKEIITRNIKGRLEQESTKLREQWEAEAAQRKDKSTAEPDENSNETIDKMKAESAKLLEETIQKAEKSKEQAVTMESKKWNAKVSMAEGRARSAMAKIEFVSKAATETPQRPVAEVWGIAKDVKAAPTQPAVTVPSSTSAVAGSATAQPAQTPLSPAVRKPSTTIPATTNTSAPDANPDRGDSTQPQRDTTTTSAPQGAASGLPSTGIAQSEATPSSHPSTLPAKPQVVQSQQAQPQLASGSGVPMQRGGSGQGSGIPRGGASNRAMGRGNRGGAMEQSFTANNASQAQQQHAHYPVQTYGPGQEQHVNQRNNYGSNIPRGGGRGRGRGNMSGMQTSTQSGSPGSGYGVMNAEAYAFQPGNKRPRGDSPMGGDEAGGKRVRGGGMGN